MKTGIEVSSESISQNGEEKVPVSSLAELTGFPADFIKSELILKGEELSMDELRSSMLAYLEKSADSVTQ